MFLTCLLIIKFKLMVVFFPSFTLKVFYFSVTLRLVFNGNTKYTLKNTIYGKVF